MNKKKIKIKPSFRQPQSRFEPCDPKIHLRVGQQRRQIQKTCEQLAMIFPETPMLGAHATSLTQSVCTERGLDSLHEQHQTNLQLRDFAIHHYADPTR
jgi:hypothetical protein